MRNALYFCLLFAFPFACTPEKHKAASQNNQLVAIHGEVVKALSELDASKKDNVKFVEKLESTINIIKKKSGELSKLSVLSKLTEVKDQLAKSLGDLETGYSEVLDLYKNEKPAEARTRMEAVEKTFQNNTQVLQEMQARVAKAYDIPIASPSAAMTPDTAMTAPAEAPADMPAAPAEAPADMPAAPAEAPADMPVLP